jgi:DNA polymerase-3 subunit epsilon
VAATAFVWRELAALLDARGVMTWDALHRWLAGPPPARLPHPGGRTPRRVWPMPREARLALPDAPGVYRMLRTSGGVLYVGKATSLNHSFNSYFRKQHGIHERTLEMLSQARGLSIEVTATSIEAALLEADEIKRLRPPYNVALTDGDRRVWYATPDLLERSASSSVRHCCGPLISPDTIDEFAALTCGSPLEARRLLRLGTQLWREGRRVRDEDLEWLPLFKGTPEQAQAATEQLALRATLMLRRSRWLTRLFDSAVVWQEPGLRDARLVVIERGEIVSRDWCPAGTPPPVVPGHQRPASERRAAFTIASFDRLRVLMTELKRISSEGSPVAIRFGAGQPLTGARLARVFAWI